MKAIPVETHEQSTVVIGMFRYYLGRKTYAVSDCVRILINWYPRLVDETRKLIRKELEAAIAEDSQAMVDGDRYCRLGMDMDRSEWLRLYDVIVTVDYHKSRGEL